MEVKVLDHGMVTTNIIVGDTLVISKTLPKEGFSLILSSPPYNMGKEYEKKMDIATYLAWQESIISDLVPLLSNNGNICWQVGNYVDNGEVFPLDIYLYPIFKKLGLQLRNRIIWHFGHGLHAKKRFSGRYETLLWFSKSDNHIFNLDPVRVPSKYPGKLNYKGDRIGQPSGNPLGKNPSDFWATIEEDWDTGLWDIPNVKSNHPEKVDHPCQFPIELAERCILALSNEGDSILDPFMGVGSTLIASTRHNRNSTGIDMSSRYCSIAERRLRDFDKGILPIRPLGKPVYQPTGKEKISQIPVEWTKVREDG